MRTISVTYLLDGGEINHLVEVRFFGSPGGVKYNINIVIDENTRACIFVSPNPLDVALQDVTLDHAEQALKALKFYS